MKYMDITKEYTLPSALLRLGGLTAFAALAAASAVFFQQALEDLVAYLKHSGRKVIQDSEVVQLLRRKVCPPLYPIYLYE